MFTGNAFESTTTAVRLAASRTMEPACPAVTPTDRVIAVVRQMFGRRGRQALKKEAATIKTMEELEERATQIRGTSYGLPSDVRKVLRGFAAQLPRRGGPGRTPKLNPAEEEKARKHILWLIGRGAGTKKALSQTAEKSLSLFGKRVSARTLQKVWNKRKNQIDA